MVLLDAESTMSILKMLSIPAAIALLHPISGGGIQNITFENLKVNGNVILNAASGNISVGNNISNVNFIASGGTPPAVTPFPPVTPHQSGVEQEQQVADSSQAGNPASGGNDSSTSTRWSANDGSSGHSWTADLGSSMRITAGTQVMWEQSGKVYKYKIETSNDNTNWTMKVDKTANTSTDQTQTDNFTGQCPFVRITVTGLAKRCVGKLLRFQGTWRTMESGDGQDRK